LPTLLWWFSYLLRDLQLHSHEFGTCIVSPGGGRELPVSVETEGRPAEPDALNSTVLFSYNPPSVSSVSLVDATFGS
jgi:hypothetical protein